ncbi:MAG: DUF456 family protein [Paludibacteraceae bacterium]|nr:DUF456 family protein [Paludibacteraceae bacterium]
MDIFLIIIGAICLLLGLIGCVAPVLPGVPLSYLGLLLLHWTDRVQFSWQFLVVWGVVVVVIQILDYFIPAWGTKKFGGTKYGVWGSTIGLFVGLFMGPLGIVIGPFIGAVLGELIYFNRHPQTTLSETEQNKNSNFNRALRAGFGSFIGLLTGTLIKVICCGVMIAYFVKELI